MSEKKNGLKIYYRWARSMKPGLIFNHILVTRSENFEI